MRKKLEADLLEFSYIRFQQQPTDIFHQGSQEEAIWSFMRQVRPVESICANLRGSVKGFINHIILQS